MRDRYWSMYTSIKHKERYYHAYSVRSKRINGAIIGVCAVFSTVSVASWTVWKYIPWLWAIIVIVIQVVQALSPLLPFSKQLVSLKFLLPGLSELLLEVDEGWRNIDESSDGEINALITKFEKRYNDLKTQFIGDTYFPELKSCEKCAEEASCVYFSQRYDVVKEG